MARILIVEDNPMNMELATLLVEKAGHSVIQAKDAQSGLRISRTELLDLILMDVQLPGMSGLEAVVLLKASPATKSIPIIALTALAMNGDEELCLAAGCDDYISKPLRYKVLWAVVEKHVIQPQSLNRKIDMNNRPRKVLIVDDENFNRELLKVMLEYEGYLIQTVNGGEEALKSVEQDPPDLILLDIMMPGLNGNIVAERLKLNPETMYIPIIMVTSIDDHAAKLTALKVGADDFLTKPIDRAEIILRVRNMLRLKDYSDLLSDYNNKLEDKVKERTTKLENAYKETIITMVSAAEFKDEETGAHVRRIAHYSYLLGRLLGLSKKMNKALFYASPMHDIGKIGISDAILFKTTPFTPQERETMNTHSAIGAKILQKGDSPFIKMGAEIALNHHERWDGTGYPNGLSGEDIPLPARIMALCDVYDALRSKRPYKPAFSHVKAVKIITEGDGRTMPEHFDPKVLAAFAAYPENFEKVYEKYKDGH
jgi:putative two-component system response regulator